MQRTVDSIYCFFGQLKHGSSGPSSVLLGDWSPIFDPVAADNSLAIAMFNFKMVATAGGGIKKIFNFQQARFFPLPDYDLSNDKVKVSISGKILDMNYSRLLAQNKDLTLEEIIMLDKLQKKQALSTFEEKHLRRKNLIEGRKPNYYIGI